MIDMEKLQHAILFILEKSPNGRTKLDLCKLLYYADGVSYQKHKSMITNATYYHLEESPFPAPLFDTLVQMKKSNALTIEPFFSGEGIQGFRLKQTQNSTHSLLTKEEKRILSKVLEVFKTKVESESSHYPNLYENYVVTPLYEEIPFREDRINTKVHVLSQKRLMEFSGKMYKILFERSQE